MSIQSRTPTILLVDDDEAKRYTIGHTLRRAGYMLQEATTGQEALDMAQSLPDLIVLDVKLPDISGLEVCRRLKAAPLTASIPILHVSATFVDTAHKVQGLEGGADGYLTQDAEPTELIATVRALLRMRETEDTLRRQNERLKLLSEASSRLLSQQDATESIDRIIEQVARHLKADAYLYFVLDETRDYLVLESFAGVSPEIAQSIGRLGMGESVSGAVAASRQPVIINYLQASDNPHLAIAREWGARAYASHPLVIEESLFGTLSFALRDRDFFTEDEIDFLSTICRYIAIAKERVRLLREKTERAERLVEKDDSLQLALSAARMYAWEWDFEKNELIRSETASSVLGVAAPLIQHIEEAYRYIHPDDAERHRETVDQAMSHCQEYISQFRHVRPDDERVIWLEDRGKVTRSLNGRALKACGITVDITERKQVEEALREASRRRDEFLANISHELRTPMNAVIGLAGILASSQPLTDKQRQYIDTLKISAHSLLELINDMLDIAKIESGQIELEHIPFHLAELIDDVANIMSVRAKEKGIELNARYDGDRATRYIGDPTRLKQSVLNLVSNAVKFTESGSVTITVEPGPDATGQAVPELHISVIDTGIGIPRDKLDSIFGKFTQADASITRKYGGTGLGLSITKKLIGLMGGRVLVESTVGRGSTFTLAVPLLAEGGTPKGIAKSHPQPASSTPPGASVTGRPRILLVEDYEANVLVATTLLEEFGYEYALARNGIEALEKLSGEAFDLILMDVQMPNMGGFETTGIIREREAALETSPIPIIGITAHALTGDREKCIAAGMDGYVSKPFQPEELKETIGRFIPR